MADGTKIEWTDATWNPITGCSVVSPGCTNCYAMRLAGSRLRTHESRAGLTKDSKAGPVRTGEVRFNAQWIADPLKWRRPRMIFVCAHGDLFAEGVPDAWIDQVFAVMALCPQHTFQVLTKRPERMRDYLTAVDKDALRDRWYRAVPAGKWPVSVAEAYAAIHPHASDEARAAYNRAAPIWPLTNVWLGVSVEDQKRANERIPVLLETPAALRWISAEPLLGRVYIPEYMPNPLWDGIPSWKQPTIDWVVAGGESGQHARAAHPDWFRSLRDQCAAASVPFHFKQWGNWHPAPWKLTREEGETVNAYKARSEAEGATHAIRHDSGFALALDHRPWSCERAPGPAPHPFAGIRHASKAAAGRMLDGVLHDAFPEVYHG